ncbi:YhcB family protein [Shewanella benthica]|uniref:ZapG family protein n=1 Tax=Shewanella benthica TaxID=43661 RepID=UPI001879F333|nr:DUF1043 family protein [Shewanella benthica]MBE7214082.1 DUF1043 family protein [Shewanella benthica]MCL1061323.1 YhcB family protein [Shewanella benthica]
MEWPLVIATFVLGILLGYVGRTIIARNSESNGKGKAHEQTKLELSQHKQEVTDHFELHHKQLAELAEQLNKINKQWNEAANTLAPKSTAKPLASLVNHEVSRDSIDTQANELNSENVIIVNQKN